jgi:uncharacterized membrane protein YtjA (UPF0391 family)
MVKRARISLLVALVMGTLGFLGVLEISIAQLFFYLSLAFAVLSFALAMFEADAQPGSQTRSAQPRSHPIHTVQSLRLQR